MAKRAKHKAHVAARGRKPKSQALPGLEDHAIKPLEDVAESYAEIRDARMELTQREHETKSLALKLMAKYGKTIYRHNGVEIVVVPGEDDVKVRVKKPGDDAAADAGDDVDAIDETFTDVEQSDERRDAVDGVEE
jgi:hypothetical protein